MYSTKASPGVYSSNCFQHIINMWTICTILKENKLIGQGLSVIRQRESHAMCIMQNKLPMFCVLLSFATHSLDSQRHSQSQAFTNICTICKTGLLGS